MRNWIRHGYAATTLGGDSAMLFKYIRGHLYRCSDCYVCRSECRLPAAVLIQ